MGVILRPIVIASYILLIVFSILSIAPLVWSFLVSLHKTFSLFEPEAYSLTNLDFSNYARLLADPSTLEYSVGTTPYLIWFMNSSIVAISTTAIVIPLSLLAGYGFAAHKFRGRNTWFFTLLLGSMLPFPAAVIPLFQWFATLGLVNTYPGLIIPMITNVVPVFWMTQYISTMPHEIFDAAKVDGASSTGILFKIVLPLVRPAVAIVGIYIFWTTWNLFFWPLVIATSGNMYTLTVGISSLHGANIFATDWGLWMAAVCFSMLPLLIMFIVFQRYFIKGLTMGALKG